MGNDGDIDNEQSEERGGLAERDQDDHSLASGEVCKRKPDGQDLRADATESSSAATDAQTRASPKAAGGVEDGEGCGEHRVQVDRVQDADGDEAGRRHQEFRGEERTRGEEREEVALVHAGRHRVERERDDGEPEKRFVLGPSRRSRPPATTIPTPSSAKAPNTKAVVPPTESESASHEMTEPPMIWASGVDPTSAQMLNAFAVRTL